MNIAEATEQIEGAVRAYLAKDDDGLDMVPPPMQRPIILMGPPGIGKTAVVSQVAERLGINFVSYSITHHTRQSALGLPYIGGARFGERDYRVSRYTMSEIIAAAYDAVERSGTREGILFLDEVNCASETLMPSMLQFLQYKTFGQHRLPADWVIVCAGNPPEYNRAAREFDPAMMDRLKRIDIEPDLDVWMDYATTHGVHPAVTSYLASKPAYFYRLRAGVRGARIVTARGWEDLSRMIGAYRREGMGVSLALVSQYLQDREVAEDFSLYLELFSKYEDDYKVQDILGGTAAPGIADRARDAALDERIALINLLLGAVLADVHALDQARGALELTRRALDGRDAHAGDALPSWLKAQERSCRTTVAQARAKGTTSEGRLKTLLAQASLLARLRRELLRARTLGDGDEGVVCAQALARCASELDERAGSVMGRVDNALDFLDACCGDGQEMLVFVTHLAVDEPFMRLASEGGAEAFVRHSQALMLHERGIDLLSQAERVAARAAGTNGS
ncbi:ATP-binding protein [Olsenella massiliensis]|uniref:ATP-binding protein n=1 Tax=Olsenella massiliensis TaxID=1622075 RepID=UPI00071E0805|nr:MoxR family ATPase [Olsenella massiliensis]